MIVALGMKEMKLCLLFCFCDLVYFPSNDTSPTYTARPPPRYYTQSKREFKNGCFVAVSVVIPRVIFVEYENQAIKVVRVMCVLEIIEVYPI